MKERTLHTVAATTLIWLCLLAAILSGCGRNSGVPETAEPVFSGGTAGETASTDETQSSGETGIPESPEATAETGRQDGERFEDVIMLEGMEETVQYEHIRNDALGFEMDYDYELFVRQREPDRERFLSAWDDPEDPQNYLEVTYSAEDADAVRASVTGTLSQEYDLFEDSLELDRAGRCVRVETSLSRNTNQLPDPLQVVYIVPAADGCRVATAHYAIEAAEGIGRRFSNMINTLIVLDRAGERPLSDEEALAAIRSYCYSANPDLAEIVNAGEYPVYWEITSSDEYETVVLFRSYTGAQMRYYIDRTTGNAYATEYVPGISSEEARTEESLNVRDYL